MPPELGDNGAALVPHGDIVDAAALGAVAFRRLRHQSRAEPRRRQKGNAALLGDGPEAVGIAGERQGAVRQGEDEAAMAEAVTIDHALGQRHGEFGAAGGHFEDFHAQTLTRLVVGPHRLGAAAGNLGGVLRHAASPWNLGARFSRKALMPSTPSGEALASFCRSRSRSSWLASALPLEAASARLVRASA